MDGSLQQRLKDETFEMRVLESYNRGLVREVKLNLDMYHSQRLGEMQKQWAPVLVQGTTFGGVLQNITPSTNTGKSMFDPTEEGEEISEPLPAMVELLEEDLATGAGQWLSSHAGSNSSPEFDSTRNSSSVSDDMRDIIMEGPPSHQDIESASHKKFGRFSPDEARTPVITIDDNSIATSTNDL